MTRPRVLVFSLMAIVGAIGLQHGLNRRLHPPRFVGVWAQRLPTSSSIHEIWTLHPDGRMETEDSYGIVQQTHWSATDREFTIQYVDQPLLARIESVISYVTDLLTGQFTGTTRIERTMSWERVADDSSEILRLRQMITDSSGKREYVIDLERVPDEVSGRR